MTDTSLPSQSSSAPAVDPSYVDSYAPPASASPTPAVSAPVPSTPATATPPSSSSVDPLEELEKALKEYEERQKELTDQKQAAVEKTQAVVQKDASEDPLEELERVLDEYEAKYPPQSASAPAPNTAGMADSVNSDPPLTQDQQKSILKDEPVRTVAEPIEEQNIFELLGVMDAQQTEKEAFLDELQEALWEDFLDKDLSLLVTPEQLKEVQDLRAQTQLTENERQAKLIAKVESLVPDIEEIMLEKALELKEDMVRERVTGMKEYYATRPEEMKKIQEAEAHLAAGRWKSGTQLLNSIAA